MTDVRPTINVRKILMAGATVALAGGIGWVVLAVPMVYGRWVRGELTLWEWLRPPSDVTWPKAWPMISLLLVAVGGRLLGENPPQRRAGAMGWWWGFLAALVIFVWMVRGGYQNPGALLAPVMLGCGMAWMAGAAVLRYFWMPVLMVLAVIPPLLVSEALWSVRRMLYILFSGHPGRPGWYEQIFGTALQDVPWQQVIWVESLPHPYLSLMAAALFAWAIQGRGWLKGVAGILALAHWGLDVCYNTYGC